MKCEILLIMTFPFDFWFTVANHNSKKRIKVGVCLFIRSVIDVYNHGSHPKAIAMPSPKIQTKVTGIRTFQPKRIIWS